METQTIHDADLLLRRIPFTDPRYIKDDNSISSFAFKPRTGENGLSVNIERLTTYDKSVLDRTKFRLSTLPAEIPRTLALDCVHDPQPENYAHALITGKITNGKAGTLARNARWFSEP